jgi:hypothetical protein
LPRNVREWPPMPGTLADRTPAECLSVRRRCRCGWRR